jgi:hypothetical protein
MLEVMDSAVSVAKDVQAVVAVLGQPVATPRAQQTETAAMVLSPALLELRFGMQAVVVEGRPQALQAQAGAE